ncbi:hypothetical protein FD723_40400 (plasmid) [Nostoc sp. C052]|uniref:hypothetical protein n=1 Tax=Nostoc sp. C052 TaxID=2576902 RepID=UPI0015C37EAC|nr:hypothetical protein [Nostoc sp. C052]QLE46475.1 hypothetical protein FD723_40400 [Nostoc sp. C052]
MHNRDNQKSKLAYWVGDGKWADVVFPEQEELVLLCSRWEVERSPEYDKYAELGHVPREALMQDGWNFDCLCCDRAFCKDDSEAPVFIDKKCFCSQSCYALYSTKEKDG